MGFENSKDHNNVEENRRAEKEQLWNQISELAAKEWG